MNPDTEATEQGRQDQLMSSFAHLPPIMTTEGVAEMLSMGVQEVRRITRDGRLPGKRIGKAYRYFRDDIIRWLDGQPGN